MSSYLHKQLAMALHIKNVLIINCLFFCLHFSGKVQVTSAAYDMQNSHLGNEAISSMANDISSGLNSPTESTTMTSGHIVSSCTAFINDFSKAAAEYTKCSISFSRPLRFCENCVTEYLSALESYNTIMEGNARDEVGARCGDVILKSDRIQIIEQTFEFIQHIWDQCHCDACFFGYDLNTTRSNLNNDTMQFMKMADETTKCFRNYTHGSDIMPFVPANQSVDPAICEDCRDKYNELNKFYYELSELNHGAVCMDIIDIMNSTRLLWSKEFHCSRHQVDNVPVILLSIFFCSLPVLFYVSNKIHGTKTAKKLLKQKRLRESQTSSIENDTSTEDLNITT